MKLLVIADAQSPHAQGWLRHFVDEGHEVHVISTYPISAEELNVRSVQTISADFSAGMRGKEKKASYGTNAAVPSKPSRLRGSVLWKIAANLRNVSAPYIAQAQAPKVRKIILDLKPDVVHSLRIPFEGIIAALAMEGLPIPLIVSTWGTDFTMFAEANARIMSLSRRVLQRADAFQPDCRNDLTIAYELGYSREKAFAVLPGNGGTDLSVFGREKADRAAIGIAQDAPLVVNPRGLKGYVRNDLFFEAIPIVLKQLPTAKFIAIGMAGKPYAEEYVDRLGIRDAVQLTNPVDREGMARLLASADVMASPNEHDGTPNTIIEAMASGAYPVAFDIAPIREWITDRQNGRLVSPFTAEAYAEALIEALKDTTGRERAATFNRERVDPWSKPKAKLGMQELYAKVLKNQSV
jgi:glycosyltransferase involved in cell wall biosynthesis